MALTMTRTRTQTALTKLVELVANVHGELAFVEGLLACYEEGGDNGTGDRQLRRATGAVADFDVETGGRLMVRRRTLLANRDALYATVRQFDPEIDPGRIGTSDEWRLRFGRRGLGAKTLLRRYLGLLATQ